VLVSPNITVRSILISMSWPAICIITYECFIYPDLRGWLKVRDYNVQWRQHFRLGRWNLASSPFQWAYSGGFPFLVASTLGVEAVGVLKALDLMLMPFRHFMAAAFSALLVAASRHRALGH